MPRVARMTALGALPCHPCRIWTAAKGRLRLPIDGTCVSESGLSQSTGSSRVETRGVGPHSAIACASIASSRTRKVRDADVKPNKPWPCGRSSIELATERQVARKGKPDENRTDCFLGVQSRLSATMPGGRVAMTDGDALRICLCRRILVTIPRAIRRTA